MQIFSADWYRDGAPLAASSTAGGRDPYSWQLAYSNGSFVSLPGRPASAPAAPPLAECLTVGTVLIIGAAGLGALAGCCCVCCCLRRSCGLRPSSIKNQFSAMRAVDKNVRIQFYHQGPAERVRRFCGTRLRVFLTAVGPLVARCCGRRRSPEPGGV